MGEENKIIFCPNWSVELPKILCIKIKTNINPNFHTSYWATAPQILYHRPAPFSNFEHTFPLQEQEVFNTANLVDQDGESKLHFKGLFFTTTPIAILTICRRNMKIFHFDDIITREQALLRNLHFQVISLFYIDRYSYFLLKYVVICKLYWKKNYLHRPCSIEPIILYYYSNTYFSIEILT